jgi:hypothetical protein
MLANERHEGNRPEIILPEVLSMAPDPHETLVVGGADRHHETAVHRKLPAVGLRHLGPAGSHEDAIKRRLFGPPQRAVSMPDGDVAIAEFVEAPTGGVHQQRVALDRIDVRGQTARHGCGVPPIPCRHRARDQWA